MTTAFNDTLDFACKHDSRFKAALASLKGLMPGIVREDLFTFPLPDCIGEYDVDRQLVTKKVVHALLALHFQPHSLSVSKRKSIGSDFVGVNNKREVKRPTNYCIYFPRDHLVNLFGLIFKCQDFTHRTLESTWKYLDKQLSDCKTFESREFICAELFDFSSYPDLKIKGRCRRNALSSASAPSAVSSVPSPREKPKSKNDLNSSSQSSQTRFRLDNSRVVLKTSRPRLTVRLAKISLSLKNCNKETKRLKVQNEILSVNNDVLFQRNTCLLQREDLLTRKLAESVKQTDVLKLKLKDAKTKEQKLNRECRYLENELVNFNDITTQVDDITVDPDFKAKIAGLAKDYDAYSSQPDSANRDMKQIPMRTSRKNINPSIIIAISILRMIGNCSLEKTLQTLVLLGNLVFGQCWVLGSDISGSKSRQRSIVPEKHVSKSNIASASHSTNEAFDLLSSDASQAVNDLKEFDTKSKNSKRKMHKITHQTAPVQSYIRKIEHSLLTPLALQSVAQELKDPNLLTSTLMYDGCSIKKGKALTVGVVNAIKDPETGDITSHYRNIGVETMISSGTDSTFRAVTSTMRNIAVLDSSSAGTSEVRDSLKESFTKINHVVADLGPEMKPTAKLLSEFKQNSLGHTTGLTYIHCNAHVCPALDTAIDLQLREIEKMLELQDHVSKNFNSNFFTLKQSNTCTMLYAFFRMLGTAVADDQTWSCMKEFNIYLNTIGEPSETFFNPKISRFAKESEMCFILAYNYESVSNFLSSVLRENKVFKACSLYIKCPYFREILTSISLLFYHIYAPFLVAVGAETMFGHKVLTHGQFLSYYPKLKEDLKHLTTDASPFLSKARLTHLSEFPQLTTINKAVYRQMTDKIFCDLQKLDANVMKGILTLICEEWLIVIHRQVEEFYGGPDSIVGKAVAANPEIMNHTPVTSLACEHSVGVLRQTYHRGPMSKIETLAQFQMIKNSRFFRNLLKGRISVEMFGKMMALARTSGTFKLYLQHKQDDNARVHQERIAALRALRKNRTKSHERKANLTNLVKGHGGPCMNPHDVDDLVNRYKNEDPQILMKLMWLEIKYQKTFIFCEENNRDGIEALFRKQRYIEIGGVKKCVQLPLEEKISNLKAILQGHTEDGYDQVELTIVPADLFIRRVSERHSAMKLRMHRPEPGSEPESQIHYRYLNNSFYSDLMNMRYIAVYYDEEGEDQKWYPGRIEKTNSSATCDQCKTFQLPECNDNFEHCFEVTFMNILKSKKKISKKGVGLSSRCSTSESEWEFSSDLTYHVPVCQIIACKVQLKPVQDIVVGSASSKSNKRTRQKQTYIIENAHDIDEFLKCNVLYMLANS